MKTYIIDTNALISFVTDRNPDQQQKIAGIFQNTAQSKSLILCHLNVLTEFVYVMDTVYNISKKAIHKMVKDFIAMPGIEVINEIDLNTVLSYWPESIPDFGDAIVASLCKANKAAIVTTFDRKFINALKTLGLGVYS